MSTILETIQAQADAIKVPAQGVTIKAVYVWKDDSENEQTTAFVATVSGNSEWGTAGEAVQRGFVGTRLAHQSLLQQIALGNIRLVSSLDPAE